MQTRANAELINALRNTAQRLANGADYNWCHMGRCNCGHLAQTITKLSPARIHEMALEKAGDWSSQSVEHCTTTGLTIDHIIQTMLEIGLTRQDLLHLERLSDQRVLYRIAPERRQSMNHKRRDDVVLYMRSFASLLEDELISELPGKKEIQSIVDEIIEEKAIKVTS
ncbi:MAG: hypothetical protein LAT67_04690 [Balneolales bacterium]|nr:hypothetical protein [Balneolales bacterium]